MIQYVGVGGDLVCVCGIYITSHRTDWQFDFTPAINRLVFSSLSHVWSYFLYEGIVPQSDLSCTIIVSRCSND